MTDQYIPIRLLDSTSGRSESSKPQQPEAASFEPDLRDACAACGYAVDDYFAALGAFGSWLAHMERDGEKYRVFWNGKSKQLMLERARPDGWDELAVAVQENTGLPGFVAGLKALLGAPQEI